MNFLWIGPGTRKKGLHLGKDLDHILDGKKISNCQKYHSPGGGLYECFYFSVLCSRGQLYKFTAVIGRVRNVKFATYLKFATC